MTRHSTQASKQSVAKSQPARSRNQSITSYSNNITSSNECLPAPGSNVFRLGNAKTSYKERTPYERFHVFVSRRQNRGFNLSRGHASANAKVAGMDAKT